MTRPSVLHSLTLRAAPGRASVLVAGVLPGPALDVLMASTATFHSSSSAWLRAAPWEQHLGSVSHPSHANGHVKRKALEVPVENT